MKDKVSELRQILNQKKAMEANKKVKRKLGNQQNEDDELNQDASETDEIDQDFDETASHSESIETDENQGSEIGDLQKQCENLKKANETQKEMYLRQAAEFENFKKRLSNEQEQHNKYAAEKILEELLPVIDSLEMTLSHIEDKEGPIASGVELTLKQFLKALEKHGVQQVSGVGEPFNPNHQEAIGTEKQEASEPGVVVTVHRKGYILNGRLVRAAMVTVSE